MDLSHRSKIICCHLVSAFNSSKPLIEESIFLGEPIVLQSLIKLGLIGDIVHVHDGGQDLLPPHVVLPL